MIITLQNSKKLNYSTKDLVLLAAVDPYVGKYFSLDYVRRQILKQKDEEIIEIDKQMKQEIADGLLADPVEVQQLSNGCSSRTNASGAMNPDPNMGQMYRSWHRW